MREQIFSLSKKDFEFQYFKASGPGGQHRNKTETAVRIIHKETGITAEAKEHKSQHQNKITAFKRLTEKSDFKIWLRKKISSITIDKELEEYVEKWSDDQFLKFEKYENGEWREE